MTGAELTKAVRAIWRKACADTAKLIKSQGFKVFDSKYGFHRYIKHGEKKSIVTGGADLLRLFIADRVRGSDAFVIGTPRNVSAERRRCLREKIDWCRSQLIYSKECIIKNETELRQLLKEEKRENDKRRKVKAVHGIRGKNRKARG